MKRAERFVQICDAIGPDQCKIISTGSGWPGIIELQMSGGIARIALHVSLVGPHARKPYEQRFQNPADKAPVLSPGGAIPILVGFAVGPNGSTVLVCTNGATRVGRNARFSILFHQQILDQAEKSGWAVYTSETGEKIYALHPELFGTFVSLQLSGLELDESAVSSVAIATGLLDDSDTNPGERARRSAEVLIRDQAFRRRVVKAYSNACAMCSLKIGLIDGAHIFPASAVGSSDKVWNGLALCPNHHRAFDSHRIWVDPTSKTVRFHPEIDAAAKTDKPASLFVKATHDILALPKILGDSPKKEMFERRYSYFENQYGWICR